MLLAGGRLFDLPDHTLFTANHLDDDSSPVRNPVTAPVACSYAMIELYITGALFRSAGLFPLHLTSSDLTDMSLDYKAAILSDLYDITLGDSKHSWCSPAFRKTWFLTL